MNTILLCIAIYAAFMLLYASRRKRRSPLPPTQAEEAATPFNAARLHLLRKAFPASVQYRYGL